MEKERLSIHQRAVRARQEARRRGLQRQALANRVGTFILNAIEHGGRMYIRDYSTVTPAWIVAMYDAVRPGRRRR